MRLTAFAIVAGFLLLAGCGQSESDRAVETAKAKTDAAALTIADKTVAARARAADTLDSVGSKAARQQLPALAPAMQCVLRVKKLATLRLWRGTGPVQRQTWPAPRQPPLEIASALRPMLRAHG